MRKSKLLMIALSAVIAIVLWLYVVTVVSPESEATLYNIPVVLQGESVLDERGLVLVSENNYKINLQLYGNRIDLNKVNSGNVTIIADLEKIYDPGSHNLSYTIIYPGDVPSGAFTEMSRVPSRLKVTVEQKITKSVPVEVTYSGSVPLDYRAKTDSIVLDYKEVSITGPASVINQIEKAVVKVDLSNRSETFEQSCRFALCNKDDEPVDAATVTTNVAEVTVTVPIQYEGYLLRTEEGTGQDSGSRQQGNADAADRNQIEDHQFGRVDQGHQDHMRCSASCGCRQRFAGSSGRSDDRIPGTSDKELCGDPVRAFECTGGNDRRDSESDPDCETARPQRKNCGFDVG